ncbi:MAG: M28 family peptidase [Balneola sp.]|nr:MAG: M28 family peptidase [Balneola sp.]
MHKKVLSPQNILLLLVAVTLACSGSKKTITAPAPSVLEFSRTITAEGLRTDLSVLAHDSLRGRRTGDIGLDMAANYLAKRYASIGLEAVGDDGTYFQHFDLNRPITNGYEYRVYDSEGELVDESSHNATSLGNFRTWRAGEPDLQGEIVFAGYGIKNETIDQYPEDGAGKWFMVFYDRANFTTMQQQVAEKGALGIILIMSTEDSYFATQATNMQSGFGNPGGFSLKYLESEAELPSAIHMIKPSFAGTLLGLDSTDELAALSEDITSAPENFSASATGYEFGYDHDQEKNIVGSKNVVAFIEGTDPELKDEVVVLSSHYDHVGIGQPDSTGDALYNGADDDGSGTVGLLHVAQALVSAKKSGAELKRSVLILHVSAEEEGLLGSRYYSDHPIYDIENTVANLNVDMIGRRDPEFGDNGNYVYIIGGKIISSGLNDMLVEANLESVNLELSDRYNDLNDPNQFYRRSDHWNFGRLGVPFIFFFNGTHADYHRPSDEIDKIDFDALTKRSKLLFYTTAKVANAEARPEVDNQTFIERTQQQPR